MDFVNDFHENAVVPSGVNSSFVTIIPKSLQPTSVKDFRPISLINSTVKILLKVLASRLATHMEYLISDTQTGFIKGRQASDSIFIVKEVAHFIQKRNSRGMILKLVFEKAFDTVNWDFFNSGDGSYEF